MSFADPAYPLTHPLHRNSEAPVERLLFCLAKGPGTPNSAPSMMIVPA